MAEIGTYTAVVAAIKASVNGLKGLKELGLSAKHSEAVDAAIDQMREAQDRVNAVHAGLIELREENHALRRTIEGHDNWQERFAQYALIRTAGGAQVYQQGEPPNDHYACPACIENQQIQILQDTRSMSGRFQCPSCETQYPINPAQEPSAINYGTRWDPFET